jgi:O-antigen/teichoic acid export membrane protein
MPLLGARAAFVSGQNLSKVVLGKLADATVVGYFAFAFQTVERLVELVQALPSALLPSLTHLVALQERERLRYVFDQAFRVIQVVAAAMSFGVFVFAPEIALLWGGLLAPVVPLLRILALVPFARTAQQPLTMLFQALGRPSIVLGLALLKFIVEFAGYFTLVPALGMAGAGWANLAGAVASYTVALVVLARLLPEGAGERVHAVARSGALLAPLLVLSLVLAQIGGTPSLLMRGALAVVAVVGVVALGLVTGYDLEKVSSIPLRIDWARRVRDSAVAAAGRVVRAMGPRGA